MPKLYGTTLQVASEFLKGVSNEPRKLPKGINVHSLRRIISGHYRKQYSVYRHPSGTYFIIKNTSPENNEK